MRQSDDQGIVFVTGEDHSGSTPISQLPDGSVVVDVRPVIRLPSDDTDTWEESACEDAFHTLAQTTSFEIIPKSHLS